MDIDFQPLDQNEGREINKEPPSIDFQPMETASKSNDNNYAVPEAQSNKKINPFAFKPMTDDQKKKFRDLMFKGLVHGGIGASQGYLNSLIGTANLLPKVNIPKLNYAPEDEASKYGQTMGDIASYFGPRSALSALKIPKLVSNALRDYRVPRAILKNLGAGSEAALYGASHAPENETGKSALQSGLMGSGLDVASSLLAHKSLLLARLGSMGIGAGVGQMFGHPYYGALAGGIAPQLKGAIFAPSQLSLAENALRDIKPQQIQKSMAANEALGTVPTPGQAAGSYVIQGREGALRKQAGKLGEDLELEGLEQQSKVGKKMLDQIYKPSVQSEKEISKAYKLAEQKNINTPEFWAAVKKQFPILNRAMRTVKSDPAFSKIDEGNYKFLAEVDRQLGRDYRAALANKPNTAHAIKNMKDDFRQFLTDNNPDYEKALKLAAPKKARENIERKLNLHEEQLSGKNIYKSLLSTPKKYIESLRILKPYPEAQKALKNMRQGWQEYANIKTGSQAEAQAKTRIDQARNVLNWVNDFLQSNIGKKATEAQLRYIHSPEWKKGFDLIKNAKNQRESINKTLDLIGKMGLAYGLSDNEIENLKSMMMNQE